VHLDEVLNEYQNLSHDSFAMLVLPVLKKMPLRTIVSESGLDLSTVKRVRASRQRPHPHNRTVLRAVASKHARAALSTAGGRAARDDFAALYLYLSRRPTD